MNFKVGDRVHVYYIGSPERNYGVITSINKDLLSIQYKHCDYLYYAHAKQCRKLKRKECRSIMLHSEDVNEVRFGTRYHTAARPVGGLHSDDEAINYVEFVEAKRK